VLTEKPRRRRGSAVELYFASLIYEHPQDLFADSLCSQVMNPDVWAIEQIALNLTYAEPRIPIPATVTSCHIIPDPPPQIHQRYSRNAVSYSIQVLPIPPPPSPHSFLQGNGPTPNVPRKRDSVPSWLKPAILINPEINYNAPRVLPFFFFLS